MNYVKSSAMAVKKLPKTYGAYIAPKITKECEMCGKEISIDWKSKYCLHCDGVIEITKIEHPELFGDEE